MSLIVQKFGGSSVKDAKHIQNVAGIIAETYLQGNDVMVQWFLYWNWYAEKQQS